LNLFTFWNEHYRIEDEELRVMVVDSAICLLELAGWNRRKLEKRRYRHPMTRRKNWRTRYSVLDVFADIIMKPVQKEEFRAEYPVKNADAVWYDEDKRKRGEVSYDSFLEGGGQLDIDKKAYIPKENMNIL